MTLIRPEQPGEEVKVHLFGHVNLVLWSTRDEAYLKAREEFWPKGYDVFSTGKDQLEVWLKSREGFARVSYSEMGVIEDVEWMDVGRSEGV